MRPPGRLGGGLLPARSSSTGWRSCSTSPRNEMDSSRTTVNARRGGGVEADSELVYGNPLTLTPWSDQGQGVGNEAKVLERFGSAPGRWGAGARRFSGR